MLLYTVKGLKKEKENTWVKEEECVGRIGMSKGRARLMILGCP